MPGRGRGPSGGGDGGFGWDPASLSKIYNDLLDGAEALDRAVTQKAPAVDAGASSDIVAAAMIRLQKIGTVVAQHLDSTGRKVDSAHGSYAEIENTTEGQMKVDELYPEPSTGRQGKGPGPEAKHNGPLMDAPATGSGYDHPRGGRMGKG